jgi:hypothetical protein
MVTPAEVDAVLYEAMESMDTPTESTPLGDRASVPETLGFPDTAQMAAFLGYPKSTVDNWIAGRDAGLFEGRLRRCAVVADRIKTNA